MLKSPVKIFFSAVVIAMPMMGCSSRQATVSFAHDIKPVLQKHCSECHMDGGEGYKASGFNIQNYDSLMKGTKIGPVIVPGNAFSSTLVALIEGRANPAIRMPHGDRPMLTKEEIEKIKSWIDQGAKNN